MEKAGAILFLLVAVVGIGILVSELKDDLTGRYTAGGGGRWYYGPQKAQLSPSEACEYSGLQPLHPERVYSNEYGSLMSLCRSGNQFVGVPLVQTIIVSQ